jgi:hypothetical protein
MVKAQCFQLSKGKAQGRIKLQEASPKVKHAKGAKGLGERTLLGQKLEWKPLELPNF